VKNLYAFILLAIVATFNVQAGTLSATADRTRLSTNETLTLTVQYDTNTDDEPDTRELEQLFTILGRTKSSSIQIINGDASTATTWSYELMPRKPGTLSIPRFTLNGDSSEAISIEVTAKPDSGTGQNQQNIYAETVLDKDHVFVQQQAVITWRLVSRFNISEPQFLPPQIDGVLTQDLGSRAYQRSSADGTTERVIEQRYALFPQQSGNIVIPPQQFQVIVDTPRRTASGFFRPARSQVRLSTDEKSLVATPADNPKNFAWLPATSLEISQEILGTNQAKQATAGTAFTRVIRIRAEGLSAEQLPPADMQADGIKVYSENPQLSNNDNAQGVIGLREDRAAIIATKPGKLLLPAINIPWYDIAANQWREAVLPETTIDVLPGSAPDTSGTGSTGGTSPSAPQKPSNTTATNTNSGSDSNSTQQHIKQTPADTADEHVWQISTAVLLTLLLVVVIYVYRLQRRTNQPTPEDKATARPLAGKTQLAILQQAAEQGDLKKMHREIMVWANEQAANNAALQHPSVRPLLQAMEKHLYGNGAAPDSQALKNLPGQLEKLAADHDKNTGKKPQLETLYR
jgi:hypothetical protein